VPEFFREASPNHLQRGYRLRACAPSLADLRWVLSSSLCRLSLMCFQVFRDLLVGILHLDGRLEESLELVRGLEFCAGSRLPKQEAEDRKWRLMLPL